MDGHAYEGVIDSDGDLEDLGLDSVFPESPRPPTPEPTTSTYVRQLSNVATRHSSNANREWKTIDIRLVGSHPLWGQLLWNAARAFASYLDEHVNFYEGKNVLELGAGGGLPGIVCTLNGARKVVLTDYPDPPLLNNLSHNVKLNVPPEIQDNVTVMGYIWGRKIAPLASVLRNQPEANHEISTLPVPNSNSGLGEIGGGDKQFDLIILSDLIFNHSQQDAMLDSCDFALKPFVERGDSSSHVVPPMVLVFFSHHVPKYAERDNLFFTKAKERGWHCEKVLTERFDPMFPDDVGHEEMRRTVHGWKLIRRNSS